jgi:hypothetical protein
MSDDFLATKAVPSNAQSDTAKHPKPNTPTKHSPVPPLFFESASQKSPNVDSLQRLVEQLRLVDPTAKQSEADLLRIRQTAFHFAEVVEDFVTELLEAPTTDQPVDLQLCDLIRDGRRSLALFELGPVKSTGEGTDLFQDEIDLILERTEAALRFLSEAAVRSLKSPEHSMQK